MRQHTKFIISSLVFLFAVNNAQAATTQFTNLSDADFENLSKEMGASVMHHSVLGAAPLGSVFGFELGILAGRSSSPDIDKIVKNSGGSGLSDLYHAGVIGAVSIPFGITGEVLYTPKLSSNDAEYSATSAALKISSKDIIPIIPFNLALRAFSSSATLSFSQTISSVTTTVEDKINATGIQLLASPNLPVIEPYVGIGTVTAKNDLSYSGTSIFNSSLTSSTSASKSPTSTQFLLGVNANILFFHLGAEYFSAFGTSGYTAKLAFGF